MAKSMTGYGRSECNIGAKKVTIEVRSLNSKTLDINLKTPSLYREREPQIRREVMQVVQRGKVDVMISLESQNEVSTHVDVNLFKAYYDEICEAAQHAGLSVENENVVATILRMPDILGVKNTTLNEEEWTRFFDCLQSAIALFDHFRTTEGEALSKDILFRVDLIKQLLDSVTSYEGKRIEAIRQRIENSLKDISSSVEYDRNRFEQEMIYYLEKLDITEEKTRLSQHCKHFHATMNQEESAGRKLGFIAQEMGREINTLGSKANHADIQQIVVRMKDELEKIKEQLLNVL